MKGWGIVNAAMLAASPAANARDQRGLIEKAEMSMLVKGGIDMRPDGSVERYSIDHSEKLSPAVTQMIGAQVSQWRFEPVLVDGKPVNAHTNMSLRIVAKPVDEQNFSVRIESASFSGGREGADERMEVLKRTSLTPMVSAMVSTGTAAADMYLALKIGPDGKVLDAVVGQVNLTAYGNEAQMSKARKTLGNAALSVVRKWTFSVPTTGELAGQPYWTGILPVSFEMGAGSSPPEDMEGRWRVYFPGPCTPVPWRVLEQEGSGNRCQVDAAPEGQITLDSSGPKLLTPLMQG